MSFRRLALVCGITLADYLLWNWSTGGNHGVLALVSGVTLPFLVLASAILLVLTVLRVISGEIGSAPRPIPRPQPGSTESHEYRAGHSASAAAAMRGAMGGPDRTVASRESPEPGSAPLPSSTPSRASTARQRAA
jgi:hypothetical protein